MSLKIGITGHRLLLDPEKTRQQIKEAVREIIRQKNTSEFEGYSALAFGADTLFAEVVLEMGGTLHVLLPFAQTEYEKDFSGEDLIKFKELLACSSQEVLPAQNVQDDEDRNTAYLECGKRISDQCEVMIAVWNGEKAEGLGGTGDIVDYIKSIKKELRIITAFQNELQSIKSDRDKTAMDFQDRYDRQWKLCIGFSLSAAFLQAFSLSFKEELSFQVKAIIASVEFLLVIRAVYSIYKLEKGELKSNWIKNRREAERLRVIEKLHKGKLKMLPLDNNEFISLKVKELEESIIKSNLAKGDIKFSRKKLQDLIDEQLNYHGVTRHNINYPPLHRYEIIQRFLLGGFIVFVAIHVYISWIDVLVEKHQCSIHQPHWISLFFGLLIPPVYAAIEGYIYFKEFKRNLVESGDMLQFFSIQKKKLAAIELDSATAQNDITAMANAIRNKMDEENISWAHSTEIKTAPGP